jgi:hypothetical protein
VPESEVQQGTGGTPTAAEVKDATARWARETRPEGFSRSSVLVSAAESLPAVLSEFWSAVADSVDRKNQDVSNGDRYRVCLKYCAVVALKGIRIFCSSFAALTFDNTESTVYSSKTTLIQYH